MIRTARIAVFILLLALVGACRSPAPRPIFAVVPDGSTGEFWRTIRAGAQVQALSENVDLLWPSAFTAGDMNTQWEVMRQAAELAKGEGRPLVLALAPADAAAFVDPVAILQSRDVPVAIFNSRLNGDNFVTYIGIENEQAGREAGEYLAKALGYRGKVALLRLSPVFDTAKRRERGFLEAIAKYPDLKVVSKDVFAGPLVEGAYRQGQALLNDTDASHGGLDGIFCPNQSTTLGMFRALEDLRLTTRIKLVGFDRTARLVDALRRGEIAALVVQDYFEMGRLVVKTLADYLRRRDQLAPLRATDPAEYRRRMAFPPRISIEFRVAVRADLADREAHHLLFPPIGGR